MKTVNKICQILAIVFGLGSVILFFTNFATITTGGTDVSLVGAQLAFGSKIEVAGTEYDMARSAQILFCFWLTVIGTAISAFSFKSKGLRYTAPGFGIVSAVYMLVMYLSSEGRFVDHRPLPNVTDITYEPLFLVAVIALFAFTVAAVAYLLIDDYIEVSASKGSKLTIPKRIVRYFKDYKSEIKKIVWPGWKDVAKNTFIVLVICLIIGAFIWVVDFGLAQLLELILGV